MMFHSLSFLLGVFFLVHANGGADRRYGNSQCVGTVTLEDGSSAEIGCDMVKRVPRKWVFVPENITKSYPDCCARAVPPLDIIPDVLDRLESSKNLEIVYEGDLKVDLGNELTPTQVKSEPRVSYQADPDSYYLLCMTDPDAPSRQDPSFREFHHWLVGNIPCSDVSSGEVLTEYIGSGAPNGTGFHRYTFLLYKQPSKLTFDEDHITITQGEERKYFSIRKLAAKYNLGDPEAINIFQAQYDDYVPTLLAQIGITV